MADSGISVVVAGGKIGELAAHYLNKYGVMAVRLTSKWDVRRLCRTLGATVLPKMAPPQPEEVGFCDRVFLDEIGETPVVVFRQDGSESRVATIVIRGSTANLMDDIERAVDDGVNTFKGLCRDGRFVAGAGAAELQLSRRVEQDAARQPGLEQYAVKAFADALKLFPKILAENSGAPGQESVATLRAAHETEDGRHSGFNCADGGVVDACAAGILDLQRTKHWALRYASAAACQVLRVDQIIMAKRAGGPKPRGAGQQDPDDDE